MEVDGAGGDHGDNSTLSELTLDGYCQMRLRRQALLLKLLLNSTERYQSEREERGKSPNQTVSR